MRYLKALPTLSALLSWKLLLILRCACDIAEMFHFDRTTISKHLALMKNLGILEDRKEGLKVYYSLRIRCLPSMLSCIEKVVEGNDPERLFVMGCCGK